MSLARAIAHRVVRMPLRTERRGVSFDPKLLEALRAGGSTLSAAGVSVTVEGSLRLTAVLGAVLMIAESLASVPLSLYERLPDGGRRVRDDHPLHRLLHDQANPLLTAFDVRAMMHAHRLLYGNAYAEIEWDDDGYPVALWPLDPQRVGIVLLENRQLAYTYWSDEFGGVALPAWRVHHQRGLMMRGMVGLSVIRTAMNAVGLGIATEEFGARYFVNGAAPSVVLSHPAKLTKEAVNNLRASFEMQWSGLNNAHRIAVVGEGIKPELLSIPIEESQFLESRQFQVKEIARIFKLPVGLLGETETATYASAEQEVLRFRELTLAPLAERQEKEIHRDLLTDDEQRTMFAQHKLAKLQATDLKTLYETSQIAVLSGIQTPNERRLLEDMNPVDGGDVLWMPMNMAPATQIAAGRGAAAEGGTRGSAVTGERRETPYSADHAPVGNVSQETQPGGALDEEGQRGRDAEDALWLQEVIEPLIYDAKRRVQKRVTNDVHHAGMKVLRRSGKDALLKWLDKQTAGWRRFADEICEPMWPALKRYADAPNAAVRDQWIVDAGELAIDDIVEQFEALRLERLEDAHDVED